MLLCHVLIKMFEILIGYGVRVCVCVCARSVANCLQLVYVVRCCHISRGLLTQYLQLKQVFGGKGKQEKD